LCNERRRKKNKGEKMGGYRISVHKVMPRRVFYSLRRGRRCLVIADGKVLVLAELDTPIDVLVEEPTVALLVEL
jgi:hypothetical protein